MRLRESCSRKDCGAQAELTGNSSRSMGMGDVCGGRTESTQADKALRRQVCPNPPSTHGSPSASPTARLPPDPTWRPAAARVSPKRPAPSCPFVPSAGSRLPSCQADLGGTQRTDRRRAGCGEHAPQRRTHRRARLFPAPRRLRDVSLADRPRLAGTAPLPDQPPPGM